MPESLEDRWRVVDERIRAWWDGDTHRAGEKEIAADPEGTLLYLPHPYISAGGSEAAFPEMYCWDTFFINQGLLAHGRLDRVRDHVLNQLFLIARHGFVPNGNRKFYLTRSQVPLLGESVRRYLEVTKDQETIAAALPLLVREYLDHWCAPPRLTPDGLSTCADSGDPARRAELAAEAETGLDFTAIYDGDVRRCAPLHVNCALVLYARAIARIAHELGREEEARRYSAEADRRAGRIRELCWDDEAGFFFEFDHVQRRRLPFWSLCAYWTLWARVATEDQARSLVGHLARFERPHGLPFTPEVYPSPHPEYSWVQWGFPSGWPPMQLVVVEGLDAYSFTKEAKRIAEKFVTLQVKIFEKTGRLWEKYNVLDGSLDLPRERYELPPIHGWSSSSLSVLGRRAFPGSYGT